MIQPNLPCNCGVALGLRSDHESQCQGAYLRPSRLKAKENMRCAAVLSPDLVYRYTLERIWDEDMKPVLFILTNPSVADAEHDDPTLRRGMYFATREGGGGVVFTNAFGYRATDPLAMKKAKDQIGPDNMRHVREQADRALKIIVAWGVRGKHLNQDLAIKRLLKDKELWCLGKTKDGYPRHPLYVKGDTPLVRYE